MLIDIIAGLIGLAGVLFGLLARQQAKVKTTTQRAEMAETILEQNRVTARNLEALAVVHKDQEEIDEAKIRAGDRSRLDSDW